MKQLILDMDSSESPTYGQQEGSAYNGHFGCMCISPAILLQSVWGSGASDVAAWQCA